MGRRPVALYRDLVAAALLGAFRQSGLEAGGPDEAFRELPAPLGDEKLKVHVVLRFRVATRCASVPELGARARRAVTSRQRGRSASGEPCGLTGRARAPSGRCPTDDDSCRYRSDAALGPSGSRSARRGGALLGREPATDRGVVGQCGRPVLPRESARSVEVHGCRRGDLTARRAEAPAIVTRMGRDRVPGSGRRRRLKRVPERRRPLAGNGTRPVGCDLTVRRARAHMQGGVDEWQAVLCKRYCEGGLYATVAKWLDGGVIQAGVPPSRPWRSWYG